MIILGYFLQFSIETNVLGTHYKYKKNYSKIITKYSSLTSPLKFHRIIVKNALCRAVYEGRAKSCH